MWLARSLKHNPDKKVLSDQRTTNHLHFSCLFANFLIIVFIVTSENKITCIHLVTDQINF